MERAIDSMARECDARRSLPPLRVFSDLEQAREETQRTPRYVQLSLTEELSHA